MADLEWNIRNVEFSPLLNGEYLESPVLYKNSFGFCLRLYPRGFDPKSNPRLLYLVMCRCDKSEKTIYVEYRLTMCNNKISVSTEYSNIFKSSQHTSIPRKLGIEKSISMSRNAIAEVLHITCEFLFVNVDNDGIEKSDLDNLSSSFTSLLNDGTSSDVKIQVGTEDFDVHTAILHARSETLAENLLTHVSEYSRDTIYQLLLYLYSGKVDYSSVPDELCVLLEKLDGDFLREMLVRDPSSISAETSIQVKQILLPLTLKNFENLKLNGSVFCAVTDGPVWGWLKLTFIVTSAEKCMLIINRFTQDINIFVRCKVLLEGTSESTSAICEYWHLFQNEVDCKIPIYLKTDYIRSQDILFFSTGDLKLLIHLDISRGEYSTHITRSCYTQPVSDKKLNRLADDFKALFESGKYSDFTIRVGETEFPVHKAVLSARSPVFQRMFQHDDFSENVDAEVIIEDANVEVVSSMLCYMYYGKLTTNLDTDLVVDLYYAANKYEIYMLMQKCSTFLQSSVDVENAGMILLLADSLDDQDLKKCVCDFVCRNAKQVMISREWNEIMGNHSTLASEILKAVLGFVAEINPENDTI